MKKQTVLLGLITILLLLESCIGDDIIFDTIDPEIRIANPVDTLELNTSYQFEFTYFNNVGEVEEITAHWSSSNPEVIQIDPAGLANALKIGEAEIQVSYTLNGSDQIVSDNQLVFVGDTTVIQSSERSGTIVSTSSYTLTGDFTLREDGNGNLLLDFADNYRASSALPGLFVYLTNNPSTSSNAHEIGPVTVFSGAHNYIINDVGINDYSYVLYYCKPFNVKVGEGEIK